MSTFEQDESGIETSMAREGIEFTLPSGVVYRACTGLRDEVINGKTFTASTSSREEVILTTVGNTTDLAIKLPVSHPLPQRYLAGLNPPRQILVTVYRKQLTSGAAERIWGGQVTAMTIDRHMAAFRVPSRLAQLMPIRLPVITAGRQCPHILYDPNCRLDRNGSSAVSGLPFKVSAQITSYNGRIYTLTALNRPNQWFQFGEMLHLASGERMTIIDQTGSVCTVQLPSFGIRVLDLVEVYAGCDHSIGMCHTKFGNQANFGGFPQLPYHNIFKRNGLGIFAAATL